MTTYNVYCDESGHLPNDGLKVMALGAIWCPTNKARQIADDLRELKIRHGFTAKRELKWVGVSPAKLDFYLDVVEMFFNNDDLHFRVLLIQDKSLLNHEAFAQDHDTWYYKMYFSMLKTIVSPHDHFRIYLDIKDTQGAHKVALLRDVLSNNIYDFDRNAIERVQTVRSHEVEQIQLADLLIGATRYANLEQRLSPAKNAIVERIKERTHYSLVRSTLIGETKYNVFCWQPQRIA